MKVLHPLFHLTSEHQKRRELAKHLNVASYRKHTAVVPGLKARGDHAIAPDAHHAFTGVEFCRVRQNKRCDKVARGFACKPNDVARHVLLSLRTNDAALARGDEVTHELQLTGHLRVISDQRIEHLNGFRDAKTVAVDRLIGSLKGVQGL